MFKSLKVIFESNISRFNESPAEGHSLELASAALLLEIGRADDNVSAVELDTMTAAMKKVFSLSDDEIADLMSTADTAVEQAVSLYEFTAVINEKFSQAQKIKLIEMLWRVAYADDSLDRYEEYYVRKIAELLYVSHQDYIKTKLRVLEN